MKLSVGDKVKFKVPERSGFVQGKVIKLDKLTNFTGTANSEFIIVQYHIGKATRIHKLYVDAFNSSKLKVIG